MQVYSFRESVFDELFNEAIQKIRYPESETAARDIIDPVLEKYAHIGKEQRETLREYLKIFFQPGLKGDPRDTAKEDEDIQYLSSIIEKGAAVAEEVFYPPALSYLLNTRSALVLGLLSNHFAVLSTGITTGIAKYSGLYNLLKKIWENANKHIHPFQKGATHQGTRHCNTVKKNLDKIGRYPKLDIPFTSTSKIKQKTLTLEEGFVLKVAAAIHDLGKAHTEDGENHHLIGRDFVLNFYKDLEIPDGLQKIVATIIEYHDGTDDLSNIGNILGNEYEITFGTNRFWVRPMHLGAIFRLADILDMGRQRVSDVVVKISLTNKPYLTFDSMRKIVSRLCVQSVDLDGTTNTIKVTSFPGLDSFEDTILKGGITFENKKLADSGAARILDSMKIPSVFVC